MENYYPEPIVDKKESNELEKINELYLKLIEPGRIEKSFEKLNEYVPKGIKEGLNGAKDTISEYELVKKALQVVAKGFLELEKQASKFSVSKRNIVKSLSEHDDKITTFEMICLSRSYNIRKTMSFKDLDDRLLTVAQGFATGTVGFVGIPFNIALSTFLYFRATQEVALYHGYDVQSDPAELEIASNVMIQALSPNKNTSAETLGALIGKAMLMTETSILKQGLKKSYTEMAKKGGVNLLFVQIRALANISARKALEKAGKKELEKTVFSEMLEQLGKYMAKSTAKKFVPVIGGIAGACFDSYYLNKIIKYSNMFYQKRYICEKENRISELYGN